jgi:hypothetical protein
MNPLRGCLKTTEVLQPQLSRPKGLYSEYLNDTHGMHGY